MNNNNSWRKTFWTIWSGQAFSILGSSIVQFALVWYLTEKTESAIVLMFATLAALLPQGIISPFIGPLIDKYDRKKIMIIADMSIAMATLIVVIMGFFGDIPIFVIMFVIIARSIGSAFHSPALQASIPMFVPEEQLGKAAGYSQSIQSISLIAGPALGAIAISALKLNIVCMIDIVGAVIACGTLLLVKIPNPERKESEEKSNMITDFKEGWKELVKSKGVFYIVILNIILMFAYMPINSFFPLMSKVHFNGDAINASIVETAFALGMLAGGIVLGIWGGGKKKVYTLMSGIFILGFASIISGLLTENGFVIFVVMSAFMGVSASLANGVFMTLIQTHIDVAKQGRVFSIVMGISVLATPLGMLVSGPIADKFGITSWFIIAGIIILMLGIVGLAIRSIRNIDKTETINNVPQEETV